MEVGVNSKENKELNIINHVRALAFDRSAASVGETKSINYIQEKLRLQGVDSRIEYFSWNTPIRLLMKTLYLMLFAYLLIFRLYLIIVLFYFIKYMFYKTRNISFVKKEESKNLISKISINNNKSPKPLVIFSAHYDSVSSRVSYKVQRVLLGIIRFIIIPHISLAIFISVWLTLNLFNVTFFNNYILYVVSILSLVTLSIIIPIFLFIFTSSKSTGSIDNASGVSILIELSKIIKEKPLKNYDVLFIWFGAEEWGLKGSKKYTKKYFQEFKNNNNLERSININIDMVGSYVGLLGKTGLIVKRPMNRDLNDILRTSAEKLNIPLEIYNKIIKPKSDYRSFHAYTKRTRKFFQVACFHSDKDSKYIHSTLDTPDKCSNKILNDCLRICYNAITYMDLQLE
ncbi:MAG: M28 family metallopeptidase [Promethearchaeota archaeon]